MKLQLNFIFTVFWGISSPTMAADFDLGAGPNLQFLASQEATTAIKATDSPLTFTSGESKTVILKNAGKADFTGDIQSALQIDPSNVGFAQTNDCPIGANITLAVSASCTVTLTFTSQTTDATKASLKLVLPSSGPLNIPKEVKLEGQGGSSSLTELPNLSDGYVIDKSGKPSIDINTQFAGGVAINGHDYQTQVTQQLADTVDVTGEIMVNPDHVGQTVDVFVYAESTLPPATETYYFMLGEGLSILLWDQQTANLVAFIPNIQLTATQKVPMYSGHFIYPGTLKVYFGYRLANGLTVENSQPIDITISP